MIQVWLMNRNGNFVKVLASGFVSVEDAQRWFPLWREYTYDFLDCMPKYVEMNGHGL